MGEGRLGRECANPRCGVCGSPHEELGASLALNGHNLILLRGGGQGVTGGCESGASKQDGDCLHFYMFEVELKKNSAGE